MKSLTKAVGIIVLIQIAFAWTGTLHAKIYKCVSEQGQVRYIDRPCPIDDDEKELQHSKDPLNSSVRLLQRKLLNSDDENNSTSRAASNDVDTSGKASDDKKLGSTTALSQSGGVSSGTSKSNHSEQSSPSATNNVAGSSTTSSDDQAVKPTHKFAALKTY